MVGGWVKLTRRELLDTADSVQSLEFIEAAAIQNRQWYASSVRDQLLVA